ncbi:hypothetical protein PspLS_05837 [Pyricularia sp. CBS 133598]|nr:hypothetical protein PspLS_05837 [Pyricularia sp. CBS 133598]
MQPGKCQAPSFCTDFSSKSRSKGVEEGGDHLFQQPSESPVVQGFQRAKKKSIEQKMVTQIHMGHFFSGLEMECHVT